MRGVTGCGVGCGSDAMGGGQWGRGARLHHAADAELEVALRAVERADHQVDDAQVEHLLVRVGLALLLLLDAAHELLGLLVLRRHDVGDAQVGEHDRGHLQDALDLHLLDGGLVVPDRLLVLRLLQEEGGRARRVRGVT